MHASADRYETGDDWLVCEDCGSEVKVETWQRSPYRQATEDREKLASYVRWRMNPQGSAPMPMSDLLAMLGRLDTEARDQ